MRERSTQILEAAVREFIRSGRPVSSLELAKRGLFGVSPATIRAELSILTRDGYLDQLHTSGGRVPTDKGYELFVERLPCRQAGVAAALPADRSRGGGRSLAEEFLEGAYREFVRDASRRLRLMGVGYDPESGDLYQSGLDDLFEQLTATGHRELTEVARDIEQIGERCAELMERSAQLFGEDALPRVFIGKRSPLTASEHLAVIVDEYRDGEGGNFFFMALGPKRMDYQRNLSLFKLLHDSIFHG